VSRSRVVVRIEALVLHGVPARDRQRLRRAIEQELGRLLAPVAARPQATRRPRADVTSMQGGPIAVTPGHGPDAIGRRVGRAVLGAVLDRGRVGPGRRD
jgi:hypothetical protein